MFDDNGDFEFTIVEESKRRSPIKGETSTNQAKEESDEEDLRQKENEELELAIKNDEDTRKEIEFLCDMFLTGENEEDESLMTRYQIITIYNENGADKTFEMLMEFNNE